MLKRTPLARSSTLDPSDLQPTNRARPALPAGADPSTCGLAQLQAPVSLRARRLRAAIGSDRALIASLPSQEVAAAAAARGRCQLVPPGAGACGGGDPAASRRAYGIRPAQAGPLDPPEPLENSF